MRPSCGYARWIQPGKAEGRDSALPASELTSLGGVLTKKFICLDEILLPFSPLPGVSKAVSSQALSRRAGRGHSAMLGREA